MIIARSPLRITLGGGGTDLPSYYEKFGGFLIAAAIDKYVYLTLHENFTSDLVLKYSRMERVTDASRVEHPIIREAFAMLGMNGQSLELTSLTDIPAGTGLGSSGSFTTALLKVLHAHTRNLVHPAELAEQACEIELGRLKEPIGKQDQYIAAYGGITCFKYSAGRQGRGVAVENFRRNAGQHGGQPAAFFHRLFAQRIGDFEGAGHQIQIGRQVHDRESALCQRPRPAKQGRA